MSAVMHSLKLQAETNVQFKNVQEFAASGSKSGVEFCLRGSVFILKGEILVSSVGHRYKINHCFGDSSGIWRNIQSR